MLDCVEMVGAWAESVSVMVTLQAIFQQCYPAFEQTHALPDYVRLAAWCVMHCRTAAMGGHALECPDGHVVRCFYNSCRHRFCRRCQFRAVEEWLAKQRARLLACDYHHLVFTIPDKLNGLWLANPERMTNLLFGAVRDTLFELLSELVGTPVTPGFLACLHTWGQALVLHPHLHIMLTDGGLDLDGYWLRFGTDPVLGPTRTMTRFRDKFLDRILRAAGRGELTLPDRMTPGKLHRLVERLRKKRWNVKLKGPYQDCDAVLRYLAGYLRGGPISDRRLVSFNGKSVTFLYRDNRKCKGDEQAPWEPMTLRADRFLQRVLLHVPPPGAHWCRGYGLYANGKTAELNWARFRLGQKPVVEPDPIDFRELFGEDSTAETYCPVCGQKLVLTREWDRERAPPEEAEQEAAA